MSLLGYDSVGSATINGLTEINANNVYSDVLYYDAGTVPVNVKTAIGAIDIDVTVLEGQMVTANANIATLQGQMTTANSNISTLQGQMTTANSNIATLQGQYTTLNGEVNTLQSEMNTAQSDINTLQSEMNTAQSDINNLQTDVGVLYGLTATNTAAIAGLSVSQAAQDVTLAAHTASIGGLNTDVNNLDNRVDNLEVKTDDQSWTTLGGTRFSRQVHISNTGASPGTDAVYLDSNGVSTFLYGISATGNIATAGVLTATSGTSQVSSLLVNNNFEVTNISYFGDTLFCDRNVLASTKKVVLYDANTGNDYDYLGFWTDSGTVGKKFLNAEIDGVAGSAFQWYYGNNLGSARTLAKYLSSAEEIGYTALATFLKSTGGSQQIQLVRDSANNRVRIDFVGDTAMVGQFDGQIIQLEGNGVDDNRGTMTVQSGNLTLNALTSATTGTLQANAKIVDINASGAITIDGATTTAITSVDDLTIQTTNPFGDILVSSAGTSTFTSSGQTQINSGVLDINATGAVTLDTTSSITLTSTNTTAGSGSIVLNAGTGSDVNINGCNQFSIITETTTQPAIQHTSINTTSDDMRLRNNNRGTGYLMRLAQTGTATGGLTINGVDNGTNTIEANGASANLQLLADNNVIINAGNTLDSISSGNTTITTVGTAGDITLQSGKNITTTSTGTTEINTNILDINATSTLTADATAMTINATTGNMTWTTSTTGDFNITSGRNINFVINSTGAIMNCTSNKDQDVFKVNNTTFDSKFLMGSATTGFRTQVNNNSYANLLGLGNTQINLTTNNASITITAGGGNAVNIAVDSTFNMTPTASIITRVVSAVPSGFLACVGGTASRTTYARLFGVIGTTYGAGDGSTTFGLPDFEGCFLRGAGTQTIGGVAYTAGAVGTAQQDSMLQAATNSSTLQGYYNVDAGGGGASRQLIARTRIATDPIDACSVIPGYPRQNTTEVRPVNHAVYYFIRY